MSIKRREPLIQDADLYVTVYTKQDLRYTFRDGTTISIADEAGKERHA